MSWKYAYQTTAYFKHCAGDAGLPIAQWRTRERQNCNKLMSTSRYHTQTTGGPGLPISITVYTTGGSSAYLQKTQMLSCRLCTEIIIMTMNEQTHQLRNILQKQMHGNKGVSTSIRNTPTGHLPRHVLQSCLLCQRQFHI